jgi:hypothetical protein
MTKWMNERDLLLAETLDYVNRLAANSKTVPLSKSVPAPKPVPVPKTQSSTLEASTPPQSFTPEKNVSPKIDPLKPIAALLPAFDRSEVKARLANFKATQMKFQREREEFFDITMAKATQ